MTHICQVSDFHGEERQLLCLCLLELLLQGDIPKAKQAGNAWQCMAEAIEMLALWPSDLPAMQTVSEMRPHPTSKLLTRELWNHAGFCIICRIIKAPWKLIKSFGSISSLGLASKKLKLGCV